MHAINPSRWWSRWRGGSSTPDLEAGRPDLVVVASSFDAAEACSAVLKRAEANSPHWSPADQAVLRHHLVLPAKEVEEAVAVAAQDGYVHEPEGAGVKAVLGSQLESARSVADGVALVLQRVQALDALHCSQEQSRMAGLAQRRGGVSLGWDALQPGS